MSRRSIAKSHGDDPATALAAEIERLSAVPLPRLAAEVMIKVFGPGGPGGGDPLAAPTKKAHKGVTRSSMAGKFTAEYPGLTYRARLRLLFDLQTLTDEALQVLEHACLIRAVYYHYGDVTYVVTRLGQDALDRGAVDRVIAGGGL